MELTSPAFKDRKEIPREYGYKKQNINPPLAISGVPDGAETLALVMDDPDALKPAGKVWDHWILWNINPETDEIGEDSVPAGAVPGETSYGEKAYGGPNPPDGEHTYRFKLYALDTEIDLSEGATKKELENAMQGHVIDQTTLHGTYAP